MASTNDLIDELQQLSVEESETIELTYLIENLVNISCYQCYLQFPKEFNLSKLDGRLKIQKNKASFEFKHEKQQFKWTHDFEMLLNPRNCSFEFKKDHLYLRLGHSTSKTMDYTDTLATLSAITEPELEPENYTSIQCRNCRSDFLQSPIQRVMPLPSSNWALLAEFWGVSDGSFQHLPKGEIEAREHRCYVGEAHVLLHQNDVAMDKFKLEADEIHCHKCSDALGYATGEASVHLHKHVISAYNQDQTLDVLEKYSVDAFVYTDMLEVAESIGCFKFILTSTGTDPLFVQLLTWNNTIASNVSPESRRVLKVFYRTKNAVDLQAHVLEYEPDILKQARYDSSSIVVINPRA